MKPEFVDNRDDNTLAAAIRGHLAWLRETAQEPVELAIASGYFNPEGFGHLGDELEQVGHVRLLLGAEPQTPPAQPKRKPGDPRGEQYDARLVEQALRAQAQGLRGDRDLLGFTPDIDATLRRLLEFLASGKIEVRRYDRKFLHGKAFVFKARVGGDLFPEDEGLLSGSSNFTAAGLTTNLELNLGRYDAEPVKQVKQWFEELWAEAEPFDLAAIYDARFQEYDPYLIYLRFLWELYGDELGEEEEEVGRLELTTFQNDGLFRAKRILREYNGVLIADGVGLGKTYIGGELLREAVQDRRQRALLIAPAALRDGTWAAFQDRWQLYFETVSYEQLLAGNLRHPRDEYALVVIDEGQAFRNPSAQRADALRRLLQGEPPKQLVFLSATPVSNSLWDLYYLLSYFVGHDAVFAHRGVRSLRQRFVDATKEDPYDLRPDMLFDILDTTTVRRTRHFVQRYYPNDRVTRPDGTEIRIRFPEPHVRAVKYDLGGVLPGFFDDFAEALAPADDEREPSLTMARYMPSRYRKDDMPEANEMALVGLIRSGLLKRFESSVHAFARTARRMADAHKDFLEVMDEGYVPTPEVLAEWGETDSDEAMEELLAEGEAVPIAGYEEDELRQDVRADQKILQGFAECAESVLREDDPKLAALVEQLASIAAQAEKEGLDDEDIRNRRKVLIFSFYEDTVDWIVEYLEDVIESDDRLVCYRGRIASVAGAESRGGVSRAAAVHGFAPVSTEAPPARREDRFDILVTTDVLAEGMNLQQCCNIINYDLPWNPMRLVQRNGRIDRIGSPYADVYVRCFFPAEELEDLLDLELRIRRKLAQAAASIGVESEVIPDAATSDIVFTETRAEIERLRREHAELLATAGEDPTAHSGEEYRQELRAGMQRRGDEVKDLPWAAGSGFIGKGPRGHVFCARVGDHVFLRFVRANDNEVVGDTLTCLSKVTCTEDTPRHMPDDLRAGGYDAWARARRDIYDEWMFATDPANLQPRVRPLFRRAADHVRRHPPRDMTQEELDRVVDALEAPWGLRIERQFREIFDPESDDPQAVSGAVVGKVHELGLRPYVAPEPLPVIDEEDIALVCWMAVEEGAAS